MSKAVRIAISLPLEVLEAAERERQARGETRSEFFRRAAEAILRRSYGREAIERYLQGYQEQPETEEEVTAAHQISNMVLSQEPWE